MELRIKKAVSKTGSYIRRNRNRRYLPQQGPLCLFAAERSDSGSAPALAMPDASTPSWPQFATARKLIDGRARLSSLRRPIAGDIASERSFGRPEGASGSRYGLAIGGEVGVIPMLQTCNEMAARDFGLIAAGADGLGGATVRRTPRSAASIAAAVIAGANPATGNPADRPSG